MLRRRNRTLGSIGAGDEDFGRYFEEDGRYGSRVSDVGDDQPPVSPRGGASGPVTRQLIEVATAPAAMAVAALVLGTASLFSLAPAAEIGQLDTSDDFGGLPIPSAHALQISVGIRFAVSMVAVALAMVGVRRLIAARAEGADTSSWAATLAGAATIVVFIAAVLNFMALFDALVNSSSVSDIYNHIGS
jgi:hypothetical protein